MLRAVACTRYSSFYDTSLVMLYIISRYCHLAQKDGPNRDFEFTEKSLENYIRSLCNCQIVAQSCGYVQWYGHLLWLRTMVWSFSSVLIRMALDTVFSSMTVAHSVWGKLIFDTSHKNRSGQSLKCASVPSRVRPTISGSSLGVTGSGGV